MKLADGAFCAEDASTQVVEKYGADERTRTADLRITKGDEEIDEND